MNESTVEKEKLMQVESDGAEFLDGFQQEIDV
jgi:hypothetical protein